MALDIGLPLELLKQPVRAVLSGESEFERVKTTATNRRGKTIQLTVTVSPLGRAGQPLQGAVLTMEASKDDASQ